VVERNRREDRNATWCLVFIRDAENVYCKSICPWLIAMLFTLEMACFLLESISMLRDEKDEHSLREKPQQISDHCGNFEEVARTYW
jgi:hypothetical protein